MSVFSVSVFSVSKDEMIVCAWSGLFLVIGPEGVVSVEVALFEHCMALKLHCLI